MPCLTIQVYSLDKMTHYKLFKYSVLIGLTILNFYLNFPIGDYCTGMPDGLISGFIMTIFLLLALVFFLINIINKLKKNRGFDFISLLLLIVFIIGNFLLSENRQDKLWFDKELYGIAKDSRRSSIILYSNNKFNLRLPDIEWNCIYTGRYYIKGNVLRLERDDIKDVTNGIFGNEYEIVMCDSLLVPNQKGAYEIRIKMNNLTKLNDNL